MTRLSHSLLAVVLCFALSTSALPAGESQPPSNALDGHAAPQVANPVPRSATEMMGRQAGAGGNGQGYQFDPEDVPGSPEDKKAKDSPSQTSAKEEAAKASKEAAASPTAKLNNKLYNLPLVGPLLGGGGSL
ncbi:hypothetical protein PHISCL_07695 [Aspergillus sclerotialis]|uniref:Uncharacterized protein n=1 Tax=Aspergillus sclerotialis TaxID=2070753 RepID=A0A3A2ZPW4_9EURO|nr:hypothetical protein PHISCL_07695 [Aspergillus sclerotialis]